MRGVPLYVDGCQNSTRVLLHHTLYLHMGKNVGKGGWNLGRLIPGESLAREHMMLQLMQQPVPGLDLPARAWIEMRFLCAGIATGPLFSHTALPTQ